MIKSMSLNASMSLCSLTFQSVCQPAEPFLKPSAIHCRSLKHLPLTILNLVEPESCGDFVVIHRARHVLFISKNEDRNSLELIFLQHNLQLLLRKLKSLSIRRVNHENHCIRVLVVASPVGAETSLTAQVPHLELESLISHSFHIETNCGHRGHNLAQVKLVKHCSLPCIIEANNDHSLLFLARQAAKNFRENKTHFNY